jgi:riboflavin kinase
VSEHTSGVYFGWAGLSTRGIYKMVMSIGWNPYFDNTEKTVVSVLYTVIPMFVLYFVLNKRLPLQEPWLLHNFDEDFYGEELRLAIVGYIRPQVRGPNRFYTSSNNCSMSWNACT